jgi:hypothetical protein
MTLSHLRPRIPSLAAASLVTMGLVLRLRIYLSGRSLWLDEAMLALNLVRRDFVGLLLPLDYDQGAPLGFLLAQKLVLTLFGSGDLILRLLPFLAGCAALAGFAVWSRRILSTPGWLLAVALFALHPDLLYYTSEAKQYSLDVFIVTALLLLTPARRQGRSLAALTAIGALALWFSHPAIFVLTGLGQALMTENLRDWKTLARIAAAWLGSFALAYLASLRSLSGNTFLLDYWREFFMPVPPNFAWFEAALGNFLPWPAALLALAGIFHLWRTNRFWANAFLVTFLAALAVSALGKYPFGGRMILFLLPLGITLAGAGLDNLAAALEKSAGKNWANLGLGLVALVALLIPGRGALDGFLAPSMRENIHPALGHLRASLRPGDRVYIYPATTPAFRFYAPLYGLDETQATLGEFSQSQVDSARIVEELAALRGNARVWVLFAHVYEKGGFNEMDFTLTALNEMGKCRLESREKGTSVALYLCNLK